MRSEPPRDAEGASSEPFVDGQLTATLSGTWKTGGVLEFSYARQFRESFVLSDRRWSFLATLFMAAMDAEDLHWGASFVSTHHIKTILKREKVHEYATDNAIHRLANQIRARLETMQYQALASEAALTPDQWAKRLIESKKGTGYRIAMAPRNLRLFIGRTRYVTV